MRACNETTMFSNECADEVLDPEGNTVYIDKCLVAEVKKLWKAGVKTIGSCCGHGTKELCFITVASKEDEEKMVELGYSDQDGFFSFDEHGMHAGFRPKSTMKYEKRR